MATPWRQAAELAIEIFLLSHGSSSATRARWRREQAEAEAQSAEVARRYREQNPSPAENEPPVGRRANRADRRRIASDTRRSGQRGERTAPSSGRQNDPHRVGRGRQEPVPGSRNTAPIHGSRQGVAGQAANGRVGSRHTPGPLGRLLALGNGVQAVGSVLSAISLAEVLSGESNSLQLPTGFNWFPGGVTQEDLNDIPVGTPWVDDSPNDNVSPRTGTVEEDDDGTHYIRWEDGSVDTPGCNSFGVCPPA
jgi:hypothetical protein